MKHLLARLFLMLALIRDPSALAADIDRIQVPAPPSVWSTNKNGYNVNIYSNPNSTATDADRSVLLLGMFSSPQSVLSAASLNNPATGKPYDVIIGVGSASLSGEIIRVIAKDHFDASQNSAALAQAIQEHCGQPLVAHTLDLHSNGNAVGISALLPNPNAQPGDPVAFTGVKAINSMGPDVGYGGQYLNADNLNALKAAGVESVDVYRIGGDFIPALGAVSKTVIEQERQGVSGMVFQGAAALATDAVGAEQKIAEAAQAPDSFFHVHDFPNPGPAIWWTQDGGLDFVHFIQHYTDARAAIAQDVSPPSSDAAALEEDDQLIQKALADNNIDELAQAMHRLGAKLALTDVKEQRDQLKTAMQQLDQMRAAIERTRIELQIQDLRTQQQASMAAQRDSAAALKAFQDVITVRQRQQADILHQQQVFQQWAQRDSAPQPYPVEEDASSDDEESTSTSSGNSGGGTRAGGGGNYGGGYRAPPNVPMPAPDPFRGM